MSINLIKVISPKTIIKVTAQDMDYNQAHLIKEVKVVNWFDGLKYIISHSFFLEII